MYLERIGILLGSVIFVSGQIRKVADLRKRDPRKPGGLLVMTTQPYEALSIFLDGNNELPGPRRNNRDSP
jgi:hypothetical protein